MKDKFVNNPKYSADEDTLAMSIGRLLMRFAQLERHPRKYGEVGILTQTEIHTIVAIGCGTGILMSELANRLRVTRGAVTQTVSRLEDKKLVKRIPASTDSRSVIVSLTDKGVLAYQAHDVLHQKFYRNLSKHLTPEEIVLFKMCIDKLCRALEK